MAKIRISPFTLDLLARQANIYRAGKDAAFQAEKDRQEREKLQKAQQDFQLQIISDQRSYEEQQLLDRITAQNEGTAAYLGGGGGSQGPTLRLPSLGDGSGFDYQPAQPVTDFGEPQAGFGAPEAAPPSLK